MSIARFQAQPSNEHLQAAQAKHKGLTFRRIQSQDLDALVCLFQSCYPSSKTTPEGVKWKFFSPQIARESVQMGAFTADGQLVSQYANLPIRLHYEQRLIRSMLSADMATDPIYRGKGLISELSRRVYAQVEAEKQECSFGFSNVQGVQVDRFASGYGYNIVGELATFYKPVIPRPRNELSVTQVQTATQMPDCSIPNATIGLDKSPKYLQWRYFNAPDRHYEVLKVLGDAMCFYVVVRENQASLEILDLLFPSDQESLRLQKALHALSVVATLRHKRYLSLSALASRHLQWELVQNGFLSVPGKKPSYYLTVKFHSAATSSVRAALLDKNSWWIMGGDVL